jgi:hypothetical protein
VGYRELFIWVEGLDDIRFFNNIIKPMLKKKYNYISFISYSNLKKEKVKKYFMSIKSMNADYIYVTDINDAPCIMEKKKEVRKKFKSVNDNRIAIIVKEIESWYLAGLDTKGSENLGMKKTLNNTDDITKEKFNELIPKKFDSRVDFMIEILKQKYFSIKTASKKNRSFEYFIKKYNCEVS